MKKTNILFLSLVSLCLVGCNDKSNSTNKTNTNNNSQVDSSKKSTKPNTDSTDKKSDSTIKSDTDKKSDSSNSSSEDDIYTKSKWPIDIAKVMYRRLDERFVPYIDLKASRPASLMCDWARVGSITTITIYSDYFGDLTDSMASEVKSAYENEHWSVTITKDDTTEFKNVLEATNPDNDLTIKLSVENELLTLTIKFNEKFDANRANGTWDDEISADMDSFLDNHSADIPYIYLGTINPNCGADTYTPEILAINGGSWDDQILTIAKNAFDNANASISNEENKWTYEDGYYSSVKAKRTLSDGCKLEVEVLLTNDKQENEVAEMKILRKAAFTPSSKTEWADEIQNTFSSNFDNHLIPYFYIGSDTVTKDASSYDNNTATFYAANYTWDDKIYDLALTAINNDNKKYADEYKWTIEDGENDFYGTRQLKFTKDYDDGCNLSFTLDHYEYDDNAKIEVKFKPKYQIPAGAKWPDKAITYMNENLGGVLPYLHLGNITDDSVVWNADTSTLTIIGETFYSSLLNGAKATYTSDLGWNGGMVDGDYWGTTYKYFKAEKTVAEINSKLTLTVDGTYHGSYYDGGIGGYAVLKVVVDTPYTVPSEENAKWEKHSFTNTYDYDDQINSTFISDNLDGHEIPYVYLNSKEIKTYFSESSNELVLTGGKWDIAVLDHAKSQFEKANWTDVTKDDEKVTAKFSASDGCEFDVLVHKNSSDKIELIVNITFGFVTTTEWSDDIKAAFTNNLNGHELPLIQVGSKNPKLNTYTGGLSISNNNWKEGLLEETQTTLNNEGWKNFIVNKTSDEGFDTLNAYKEFDDGIVYFTLSNSSSGLYLQANFFNKPSSQTKTDWKDEEKSFIDDVSENKSSLIPFLYMGNDEYTTSAVDSTIKGSDLNTYSVIKYFETLQTLGYKNITLSISASSFELNATYVDDKGNKIELKISSSYDMSSMMLIPVMTITYTQTSTVEA